MIPISFLFIAGALALVIVALVARPLLVKRTAGAGIDTGRLNAKLLGDELAQLEREHESGMLGDAEYAETKDELARRVLDEARPGARPAAPVRRPLQAIALALFIPASAAVLYGWLGTPAALDTRPLAAANKPHQVDQAVETLANRLLANPDNPAGWALLGRSFTTLGRYVDAVEAFERIGPTLHSNADWLAEFADALAMKAGGNPVGRPEEVALEAIAIDPDQLLALMMASYAAVQRADFAAARPLAERALRLVPAGTEDERFLQNLIERGAAKTGGAKPEAAAAEPSPVLKLDIAIAPELAAEAAGKSLFVIARAPGESKPLAAIRRSAAQLPARIPIGDADSLDPSRPLSSVRKLEVEARISATGSTQAASGDLFGTVQFDTPHADASRVLIDRRRP